VHFCDNFVYFTDRFSGPGKAIGSVCVFVCDVNAMTFDLDI